MKDEISAYESLKSARFDVEEGSDGMWRIAGTKDGIRDMALVLRHYMHLRQRVAEVERERDEAWLQAATWRDRANQAKELLDVREAKLALAEQDARRYREEASLWRGRWIDYRVAYWRPTQPYEQARFLAESEAADLESKYQEARDRIAAIASQGEGHAD